MEVGTMIRRKGTMGLGGPSLTAISFSSRSINRVQTALLMYRNSEKIVGSTSRIHGQSRGRRLIPRRVVRPSVIFVMIGD